MYVCINVYVCMYVCMYIYIYIYIYIRIHTHMQINMHQTYVKHQCTLLSARLFSSESLLSDFLLRACCTGGLLGQRPLRQGLPSTNLH